MHLHPHHRNGHHCNDDAARVQINMLGGFRVIVDGDATPSRGWTRRSAAALVKILALAPGHRLHREKVMDLLWPDASPADSAPRLHKAAHYARRAAGSNSAIVLSNDMVRLFPGACVTVDVVEFERLAREAVAQHDPSIARDALALYRGELLPADQYEEWAVERRELLALRRLELLRVAEEWREVAELEPTDEDARVQLMRQHLDAGDGSAAVREYEHLERVLDRDFGVAPGPAARRARQEAIRLGTTPSVRMPAPQVGDLLAELAELTNRQHALLAELAAMSAAPLALVS